MTTGNISIISGAAYCTEQEWRDKYGFSTVDESSAQFDIDQFEAMVKLRREGFFLSREQIIFINSNKVAYLPYMYMTDGNMSGTVDKNDLLIYQASSDNRSLDTVDLSNVDSVDAFNNSVTFIDGYTPVRQHYITYFVASKPFDEIDTEMLKRAVMAKVTLIVMDRLRRNRLLKGGTGWNAAGVSVTKSETEFQIMYDDAKAEYKSFISFIKPLIFKGITTNRGTFNNGNGGSGYDPRVAYSSNVFGRNRIRRTW